MNTKFDDIRPYTDAEIPAAMQRIANSEYLEPVCNFAFPGRDIDEIKEMISGFTTIAEFQLKLMFFVNDRIIKNTIDHFSYSGTEYLDPKKKYLLISNHRDIMLDCSLLLQVLQINGIPSAEITFGSNLMSSQLVIDIGRSNKMFKVVRGGNARDFYENSLHLSDYIRHAITEKGESIWIAQRNGRTKDGNDATDQGIIKMFCMSCAQDPVRAIEELNIVPVAVSYQWEPCDMLKTKELYLSRDGAKYVKQKDEDITSIITGITQQKGNVHISLCKPLEKEEYIGFAGEPANKFYKNIANLIDERIYNSYKLWNTNYIAHDIRSGTNKYAAHYTPEEKEEFLQRFDRVLSQIDGNKEIIGSVYLGIYANPVDKKVLL